MKILESLRGMLIKRKIVGLRKNIFILWKGLFLIPFVISHNAFAIIDYATKEGLVRQTTSCGHVIVNNDWFVALPCADHVVSYHPKFDDPVNGPSINYKWGKRVRVTYNNRSIIAPVWDLGPHNHYDNYWEDNRIMFKDLPINIPESEWVVGSIKWKNNRTQPHPDYSTDHPFGLKGMRYIGRDPRKYPNDLNNPSYWKDIKNPAGIDLADGVFWYGLGSPGWVDWDFTEDLPMVKRVILTQDGKTIYDSHAGISIPAKAGMLSFKIIFNETMKPQGLPIVTFGLDSPYTAHPVISIKWSSTTYENDTWEGIFTIPEGQSNQYNGQNHIRIVAKDLGDNEIDSDENTSSYNPGPDTQHTFLIDTTTPEEARQIDAVLVIDRSGSMDGEKITSAKNSAKLFVDFMEQGDKIGVVSFSDDVSVDFPLSSIIAETTIFSDNMESGAGNWTAQGSWALINFSV